MVDLLDNIVFSGFLIITAGATLALQAGCNSCLARYAGRTFAPLWSFATGVIITAIFFAIDVTKLGTPLPDQNLLVAPGYAWLGGIFGAFYICANLVSIPRLGAATSLSIFVCSQVIMACVIDNGGLVGVEQRNFTPWRALASIGLVICVFVIAKF